MREEDTVILATLMDGQGNYDGISVSPGDALSVRIPKTAQTELLKFQGKTRCIRIRIFKSRQLSAEHWQEWISFTGMEQPALL